MAVEDYVQIVVPGDAPVQIAGSPHLERLASYGDVTLYDTQPVSLKEKVERVRDADVIMNTRGAVTWGEQEFSQLPKLKMITTCSIGTDMFDSGGCKKTRNCDMQPAGQNSAGCGRAHVWADVCGCKTRCIFDRRDEKGRLAQAGQCDASGQDPGDYRCGQYWCGDGAASPERLGWR